MLRSGLRLVAVTPGLRKRDKVGPQKEQGSVDSLRITATDCNAIDGDVFSLPIGGQGDRERGVGCFRQYLRSGGPICIWLPVCDFFMPASLNGLLDLNGESSLKTDPQFNCLPMGIRILDNPAWKNGWELGIVPQWFWNLVCRDLKIS